MSKCEMQFNMCKVMPKINTTIESYIGSKRYLKFVVPMFMCNIIYHRLQAFDEYFESRDINKTVNYMIFKPKLKNHHFADVYNWIKSAMSAFEDNHLKDLYLFAKYEDKILETYKFTFDYQKEQIKELPSSTEVIAKTQEVLDVIKTLREYEKLPKEVKFVVELTFKPGVPIGYELLGFDVYNPGTSNICNLSKNQYKNWIKVANFNTGYHKMKCVANGQIFEIPDAASEFDIMTQISKNKANLDNISQKEGSIADHAVTGSITTSEEASKGEDDMVTCPCNLSLSTKNRLFQTVICIKCYANHHVYCLGYKNLMDTRDSYICINCSKDSKQSNVFVSFTGKSPKQHRILAILRLCAMYLDIVEKLPHSIVNKLPTDLQEIIWNKLSKRGIIHIEDGREVINKNKLKEFIASEFYHANEHDDSIFHSEGSIAKRIKYGN